MTKIPIHLVCDDIFSNKIDYKKALSKANIRFGSCHSNILKAGALVRFRDIDPQAISRIKEYANARNDRAALIISAH